MIQLRGFQNRVKGQIYKAWSDGKRNVMPVIPTGGGKTVLFASIIAENQGPSVAIAHRQELTSQISLALARNGVRHRVIGQKALIRDIVNMHMSEVGRDYTNMYAPVAVAGVDTLLNHDPKDMWLKQVTLVVQDEGHHVLTDNKWGQAMAMFPNARGLFPTATPKRADRKGLGRHADGLVDAMVVGPSMRELIDMGFLTDYRIFAPPCDVDISHVAVSESTGDYNQVQLRNTMHESKSIVGDVVSHYIKIANGKLGVTFAVDVEEATKIATAFRLAGVPAEVVSAKTPTSLRQNILKRFKAREVLQLVNVDLFGEGFDLPAIEVVSMARPTMSFSLFCLDPLTEVLSPDGWKSANEINEISEVLAFDIKNDSVKKVKVTDRVYRKPYENEIMYGIEAPHLNIKVSDNHDMIVKGKSSSCKNWQKQKAFACAERTSLYQIPVAGFGKFKGANLSESDLKFLGWYLSDGTINKTTNGFSIAQSVSKTNHISDIRNTLIACNFKFTETLKRRKNVPITHQDVIQFTVSKGKPRATNKNLTGWQRLEKWMNKLIPDCYDDLTREQFLILLETLNLGDGVNNHSSLDYVKRTLTITCGDNLNMADRLQALCIVRGLRCNVAYPHYEGYSKWAILHIRDCQTATIAGINVKDGKISNKKVYKRSRFLKLNERPDFVWCLTNELGTLITRRKGKVAIVGNCQQFGRALRLMIPEALSTAWDSFTDEQRRAHIAASGKPHAIIIDHVSNVVTHGLPDAYREWSLERGERRSRGRPNDVIPCRTCLNPTCIRVYERVYKCCPFCGTYPEPAGRSEPDLVDGDLIELDPDVLRALRGEIARIDSSPRYPTGATDIVRAAIYNNHQVRQQAQAGLRERIALWAGWQAYLGRPDSEVYRRFYFTFGVDIATAQTLNAADAVALDDRIASKLSIDGVVSKL